MYVNSDTMFCPNKNCKRFLNSPLKNIWFITFKKTVPIRKREASVEEEVIDVACKKYGINKSDVIEVEDGDFYEEES